MTEDQIKHMAHRFLGWRLPEDFHPDAGISFKKTHSETGPWGAQKYEPVGTNLFSATQAEGMVRHMIDGLPTAPQDDVDWSVVRDAVMDTCDYGGIGGPKALQASFKRMGLIVAHEPDPSTSTPTV